MSDKWWCLGERVLPAAAARRPRARRSGRERANEGGMEARFLQLFLVDQRSIFSNICASGTDRRVYKGLFSSRNHFRIIEQRINFQVLISQN